MNILRECDEKLGWVVMAAVAMVLSTAAQPQPVYKWVDAEGKSDFGSQPPLAKQDP